MDFLAGSGLELLTENVAKTVGGSVINREIKTFSNGELSVRVLDSLENKTVTIITSLFQPVDTHIVELLFLMDAVERAGAKNCTVVIPWLGYSKQDKIFLPGQALSANVIADALSRRFVDRVILCDLHNPAIADFFSVPTTVISAFPLFAQDLLAHNPDTNDIVVIAPDAGGRKRATQFAEENNLPLATIEKSRDLSTGEVTVHGMSGAAVAGKNAVLVDDIINTGATVIETSEFLKDQGAQTITFYATHGIFAGDAWEKLENSPVDHVITTDSIPQTIQSPKFSVISLAETIGSTIQKLAIVV